MKHGASITLLKRASADTVKRVVSKATDKAPAMADVGHALGGAAKTFGYGAGKYLGGAGRLAGAAVKGMGGGDTAQAIGKAVGVGSAAYVPIKLLGSTRVGKKIEGGLARAIGATGRGAQKFVDPEDPYAGQY